MFIKILIVVLKVIERVIVELVLVLIVAHPFADVQLPYKLIIVSDLYVFKIFVRLLFLIFFPVFWENAYG